MKRVLCFFNLILFCFFSNAQSIDSIKIVEGYKQVGNELKELKYSIRKVNANHQANLDSLLQINNKSYNTILCLQEKFDSAREKIDSANKHIYSLKTLSEDLKIENKKYYAINFLLLVLLIIALVFLTIVVLSYRNKTIDHILSEAEKHSGQNVEILDQINDFKSLSEAINKHIQKAKEKKKKKKK